MKSSDPHAPDGRLPVHPGLRERARHRDTPVVLATSERENSQLLRDARILNPAAVVKKPWKPQVLAEIVRGIVNRSQGR